MKKTAIKTDKAPLPVARYSQAILVGDTLYTQGTIALDPATNKMVEGGVAAQTERVFESLRAILAEAGMSLDNVVKVTAYLSDLENYAEFNKVYAAAFANDPAPARTAVEAKLPLGALVEVEAVAVKT